MGAANDLLLDGYDRIAQSVPEVLDGLGTDGAAWRPDGESNSVGWLVWHLTRVMDDHLAGLTGDEQVLTAEGYDDRLGLDLPVGDTGYGHDADDVAKVRLADLDALAGYHGAGGGGAAQSPARVGALAGVVDERGDPPVTLGVRLVSVLDDAARHIGQAQYLRGLVD